MSESEFSEFEDLQNFLLDVIILCHVDARRHLRRWDWMDNIIVRHIRSSRVLCRENLVRRSFNHKCRHFREQWAIWNFCLNQNFQNLRICRIECLMVSSYVMSTLGDILDVGTGWTILLFTTLDRAGSSVERPC